MKDILDDTTSLAADGQRRHAWRQRSVAPTPEPESAAEEAVEAEFTGGNPRNVGPFVALGLLTAAALIVALAVVTFTAGTDAGPDVDVAGVTATSVAPDVQSTVEASASVSTEVPESTVAVSAPPANTAPRNAIELDRGDLVLTTFYREVPLGGGDFSLAVRLENEGAVDFALADVEFVFEVDGERIPAEELITVHARVPAGGSAVVTIRAALPPVVGTPELVVSAVNGELARVVLP